MAALSLRPVAHEDLDDLTSFLRDADLTLSGLDDPSVRLWVERNARGQVVASTGYELCGEHVLIRSVAVQADSRQSGRGTALATFALEAATAEGARRAWLFSRRSGPFWERLGFLRAERTELADVLAQTHQVRQFRSTGQLEREIAWSRPLP